MGRRPLGEKAMTGAERLRRMRERRRKTKAETKKRELRELERLERLKQKRVPPHAYDWRAATKENDRLKRQLAAARAANPGGPAEERAAAKLLSEIARLKEALAKGQREIARLEEELDLARDSAFRKWLAGDNAPKSISKRDWRAILICLHPDGHPTEKQRTRAFQVFNGLKIDVTEP